MGTLDARRAFFVYCRRAWRSREGAVAVEVAIWLPLLIMASIVLIDMIRFIETTGRIDRVSASVADLVTRNIELHDQTDFNEVMQSDDLAMFFLSANVLAQPDDLVQEGRVILTSIDASASGYSVNWTRSGPYDLDVPSRLSPSLDLPAKGTYIVAEVFLLFRPMVNVVAKFLPSDSMIIYRRFIFRSRLAALSILLPAR